MVLRVGVGLRVDRVVIAGIGVFDDGHGVVDQRRVQRLQPVDARIAAEPAHLLAGEASRLLRDGDERVVQIAQPVEVVDDLLVAERLACGDAETGAQPFHFLDESSGEHPLGADVDAPVEFPARQVEADLHGGNHVPVVRQARRIRTSGHLDDLERADGAAGVVRIHARRGLGILGLQLVEQRSRPFGLFTLLKFPAHVGIGAGEGDVVDRGTRVQTGAADEDRPHSPALQFGDRGARDLLESGHRHRVVGFDDVDQMVSDLRLLLGGRLGGADVHAAVHLVGVGVDDLRLFAFGLQRLGDGDAEAGFAGCRGTDDGDDLPLTDIGWQFVAFSVGWHRSAPLSDRDRR